MEEFIEEYDDVEPTENDEEYEFQASQFYDFTRPEFDYEIEQAERWFEVSGDYPPSPFIVKLNLDKILSVEVVPNPSTAKCCNTSDSDSRHRVSSAKKNGKGKICATSQQDTAKVQTNVYDKLLLQRSPSFMKPTASNLAKQKANHKHYGHVCTRFQRTSAKLEQKGSQSPNGFENPTTKRQKLDIGYIRNAAHLKHQFLLMHKSSKKVTVPKEPELETMLRAQRRTSKISSASSKSDSQKQKFCKFKAHPLNKKILQPRLSPPMTKKSPPRLPDFQVFHLKTTERANHNVSAKVYPVVTYTDRIKDAKQKSTISRESRSSTGAKFLESPPTEQFSKLSLGSETNASNSSRSSRQSSVKGQRKGDGDRFQAEFWKSNAKPKHCGGHLRLHEDKCWSDMSIEVWIYGDLEETGEFDIINRKLVAQRNFA
ncbi:hypothetical protein CASFOL_010425 [Castilleja foliolosa]|uniref:TPX2 central domain-containing protein n=1 Tax=Castilleja foliolosa TaxID=1961234 RepID=A0ABD3DSP1_9LAMI